MKDEFIKLEEHFCFTLYAASRAFSRLYRPILDKLNLTYPQYLVLLVLWEQRKSTVKEIGELLDLDSGTLTPLLKRMEAAQLIQRRRDPEDERVVIIEITSKGEALKKEAMCVPLAFLTATGLSINEVRELNATLKKLLRQVNESR